MECNTEKIVYFNKISKKYYEDASVNQMAEGLKQSFCCSKCNFQTRFSGYLSSHMLLAHPDKIKNEITIKEEVKEEISNSRIITSSRNDKFFCSKCNFSTNFKYGFKIHQRSHSSQYTFNCSECPYKTNVEYFFKIHFMNHSGKYVFHCTECNYKTNWKDVFGSHQMKHSEKKKLRCTECDYKTNKEDDYEIHQNSHVVEDKFQCKTCDYQTNKAIHYEIHQTKHLEYKYVCDKCDFKTNLYSFFQTHEDAHSELFPFCCEECDYKCNSKYYFRIHLVTNHSLQSLKGKYKFNCEFYDFYTNKKSTDRKQRIDHQDEICDMEYQMNHELITVKMYSNGEFHDEMEFERTVHKDIDEYKSQNYQFQCDSCNYQTKTIDFLTLHEMEHTQEITFHCSECSYFTYTKKALLLHQTIYCTDKALN